MLRLIAILALCFPTLILASAEIIFLRDPVKFDLPLATKNKIVKGSIIPIGTKMRVGDNGLVVFRGADGSVVKLEAGSALEITKMSPVGPKGETLYSIVKGSGFFKFEKNIERKVIVRTKTAAMGVRGTEFFVAHGKSSDGKDDIWMCVNEGLVAVSSLTATKPVLVKAGEGIQIAKGEEISKPRALAWTQKLNWKMDPNSGSLDNTVSIEEAYASPLNFDID